MLEWITLGFFVVTVLILGYAILFEMLPEPVQGWKCTSCDRKAIGMKSKVAEAKWDVEHPYRCPDCKIDSQI